MSNHSDSGAQAGAKGRFDLSGLALFVAVLSFFFVSGACGLLYQVVWTRKLVLLFGITSYAVATVLSIFFLGLGVGSLWGGRLADRTRRPLFLYGVFEVIIGLWALLFIGSVDWAEAAIVSALRTLASARPMAIGLRGLLALAFLFVPVTLMGATLPLLARFVSEAKKNTRGLRIGALYSINTFGAVAGCALTGFYLIAALGYTRTTLVGAGANVAAGVLAMILARLLGPSGKRAEESLSKVPEETAPSKNVALLVLIGFALSGFCALALEVLWTRLLTLVFMGTTYAFTTMLAALLCGIAAGSAVGSLVADRRKSHAFIFGVIEAFIGLSCLFMLCRFAGLPERFQEMRFDAGSDWEKVLRGKFLLSFGVLFLPTFLSGMAFPFAIRAITQASERLGRDVGKLYSVNTFGGVLGSLAGGFLVLPLLGTHRGIILLGAVLFGAGLVITAGSPVRKRAAKPLALAVAAGLFVAVVFALPGDVGRSLNRGYLKDDHEIIHYKEGVEGTVVVSDERENTSGTGRYLWINAMQATASIEKGVRMNRLQGALPLLFDREPHRVLFMCFGSGITAGTLGLSDQFEQIDAVELSKDVLEAAPLFKADNLNVIENPRVNFIVDDGRNFLLTTQNKYDLITFEPMPLAQAGVSTFYTKEYYELCMDHLAPGGLVSQWIPLHSLNTELVRSLIRTFTSVFPDYTAWHINADLFLIGSNQPLAMDYPGMTRRLDVAGVKEALAAVGFYDVPEILTCFIMDKENVDRFAGDASVMTDDRPWAEFTAPKLVYEDRVPESIEALLPLVESPVQFTAFEGLSESDAEAARAAVQRRHEARAVAMKGYIEYRRGMMGGGGAELFMKALDIDPKSFYARHYLEELVRPRAEVFVGWEEHDKVIELLASAVKYLPQEADLANILGDSYFATKDYANALAQYERFLALGGKSEEVSARVIGIRAGDSS